MLFHNRYVHALDRDYSAPPREGYVGSGIVKIRDIGQSVIDGRDAGRFQQSIQAAIRAGAGRLELSPTNQPGAGVETYGVEERQELKEIAKVNDVDLHGVHTPVDVGDMSGKTQEGFSEERRFEEIEEIKKHIDFAADVLDGGHVVVHTGEFPRNMARAEWNEREGRWKEAFEMRPGEKEEAAFYLVDSQTGRIINAVKEDTEVFVPETEIDSQGRRVAKFDEEKGEFVAHKLTFGEYRKQKIKEDPSFRDHYKLAKSFIKEINETEKMRMEGQAAEYEAVFQRGKYEYELTKDTISQLEKQGAPKEQLQRAKVQLAQAERSMQYGREIALSARKQIAQLEASQARVVSVEEYGKTKSFDSLSELGLYAMQIEKEKKTKRPIYMAPEHIFPGMGYGAHPEEIIDFVQGARKEMVRKMTTKDIVDPYTGVKKDNPWFRPGVGKGEAEKMAQKHIKATLDTQHLGMWYKHFRRKEGESEEGRLKRFNKWYMEQVGDMEKAGIIGNVHVVDGFGRGHTHVVAGQGLFPTVQAVEYLKKKGYSGHMISEAYENLDRIQTGAWTAFGSPAYGVGRETAPAPFSDIQHSYFGRAVPPPFVLGAYAPSEDWTLWSGVPLE